MAKIFIEETTLTAIGDAIRDKEGTTELIPTTEMASRITAIESGGGGGYEPTDEELTFTGDCSHAFRHDFWNWVIDKFGNRITTKDVSNCYFMFGESSREEVPFQINLSGSAMNFNSTFIRAYNMKSLPKFRGNIYWGTGTDFSDFCVSSYIRDMEEVFTPEMIEGFSNVKVTSAYSCPKPIVFSAMRSLRQIPSWWYKFKLNEASTAYPNYTYALYKNMLKNCMALDEALNIPVWICQGAQTSNMFGSTFEACYRAKNITFETNEDGTPIVTQWKSQLVELHNGVGHATSKTNADYIINNNSGITADKCVTDDATYQALKDDPDWYTYVVAYSRYNHDSAVATINSLPDTSAYLASAGGTNTIKFKGESGSATDGGAINTLTEEEIAVATAKGWTVTLV